MAKVALDIDDTLYSFGRAARQVLSEEAARTGRADLERCAYAPWPEWRTPPDLIGMEDWLAIIDVAHEPENILRQQPYPGAREVLEEVAEHHEIVYVSSRKGELENATRQWLMVNEFPAAQLLCTGHDKASHVRECQYIIDDRPSTLVRFVYDAEWHGGHRAGDGERVGFGLMTEFNRALTDVPGIYLAPPENWALMRKGLAKHGVLPS